MTAIKLIVTIFTINVNESDFWGAVSHSSSVVPVSKSQVDSEVRKLILQLLKLFQKSKGLHGFQVIFIAIM